MGVEENDKERKRIIRLDPNYRAKENEKKGCHLKIDTKKRENNDVSQNENKRKRWSQNNNRKRECLHKQEIRMNISLRET